MTETYLEKNHWICVQKCKSKLNDLPKYAETDNEVKHESMREECFDSETIDLN